ncbi:hypothetical protein H2248_003075 [Termitomyces sp. 'cryptogamus']|nr:hypothetical protein H2248_003075 [Termitomyces sp. 'cryptogamus']
MCSYISVNCSFGDLDRVLGRSRLLSSYLRIALRLWTDIRLPCLEAQRQNMSQSDDSELFERDIQSQFVSQEGDEDVLWEVVEITSEKGRFYKVRWAGVDPKTNKPWAQSWVQKSDCTDDLVHEWKRRKSKKKKKGSKGSRLSHVSHLSGTSCVSTKSSSTVTKRNTRDQSATVASVNHARNNGKRTRSAALSDEGYNEDDVGLPLTHPKKKRKIDVKDSKAAQSRPSMRKEPHVQESDNETVYESEVGTNRQRDKGKSNVLPVQKEEEESSSSGESTARIQPPCSTARKPSTVRRNAKPCRSSNTRTPTVTPDPDTAYPKFKSGKLSTPSKKQRSQKFVEELSSSSDEVDVVPTHKSPTSLPVTKDNLPTTSSTTLRQLQVHHTPSLSDPHNDEEQLVQEMYDEFVDFDAVHQQLPKGIRVSTTSNGVNEDSYRQGEVPETETESSRNTQSQSQSRPMLPPLKQRQPTPPLRPQTASGPEVESPKFSSKPLKQRAPPKPLRVRTLTLPTSPPRSSIISKMRPRTPGSSSRISLFDDGAALHQPELDIHMEVDEDEHEPDVAETKLKQQKPASTSNIHRASRTGSGSLRPIPRLSPSIFTSHLPNSSSASNHRSAADTVLEEDSDEAQVVEPVSSIEQFTPSEKGRRKRKIGQDRVDRKGKGKEPVDGHADAEGSVTDDDDSGRDELENVLQKRGQQLASHARAERLKRQRESDGALEAGKKALTEVLSENEERKRKKRKEAEIVKEKGRSTTHTPGPLWKEKDKEEDKEEEGKERKDKEKDKEDKGRKSRLSRASSEDAEHESVEDDIMGLREEEEESTQDLLMDVPDTRPMEDVDINQSWDVEPSARVTNEVEQPEPPLNPVVDKRNNDHCARSKLKSSLHNNRSGHYDSPKDELVLPPTAPAPSSTPMESQEQDNRPDFVATLALLNEKSQENAQLTKEINTLREALAAASAPRPRELELERELEVLRASLEAAQASFSASQERVADLARGKESAEKDREFFREHYAQASGFVTSVREENAELQKEAQIARDQASIGVDAVKATYIARVKALEDDAKTYKRLALFIMEKDIRTNDDIRRRAAEEPELRARCEELAKEFRMLRNEIVDLQEEVDDKELKIKELEQQLRNWQSQATVLNADLCKVKSLQEGEGKVYQCGWRVGDDANVPCDEVFATYEEFERHMFSARHLDVKRTGI